VLAQRILGVKAGKPWPIFSSEVGEKPIIII